jgi:lipoate-protein ligase A
MPTGRIHFDGPTFADEALARGATLAAAVGPERPVVLYGAPLRLASVVLGAYQHANLALRLDAFEAIALPIVRRATGGTALWGGQGVIYVALGLLDASALMKCPPGRILNRNVRGALTGLRSLGVPTNYFGRDFLSFGAEPGVYVGWDQTDDGRVLVEFFVALDASFALPGALNGYPERAEPAFRGKTPTTLHASNKTRCSADQVLAAFAGGYTKAFDVQFNADPPSDDERAEADALASRLRVSPDAGFCWSSAHDEAIGFVTAGVRLDAAGRFDDVRLGGDFFQHRECAPRLSDRLRGVLATAAEVGAALDLVYASTPGLVEGVRSLRSFEAAILDAARKAREETTR